MTFPESTQVHTPEVIFSVAKELMPALPDKFAVDAVNAVDTGKELSRHQAQRSNKPVARWLDSVTGAGRRRQDQINGCVLDSLQGMAQWLEMLTNEATLGHRAMVKVHTEIAALQSAAERLIEHGAETRQRLAHVENRLGRQISDHEARLDQLELMTEAQLQLDLVISGWEVGRLSALPPLKRLAVVLETLYWGPYGYAVDRMPQRRKELQQLLAHKAVQRMQDDQKQLCVSTGPELWCDTRTWLNHPGDNSLPAEQYDEVLSYCAYQSDWSEPEQQPLFALVTQARPLAEWPLTVPLLMTPVRVVSTMIEERFAEAEA